MFAAENCGCSQHLQNSLNAMIDEVKNSGRLLHVEGLDRAKIRESGTMYRLRTRGADLKTIC